MNRRNDPGLGQWLITAIIFFLCLIAIPLYFYVKNAHVGKVPGILEFLTEYTSEAAMGEEGYLTDKGLIPLGEDKLSNIRKNVLSLTPLVLNK